MRIRGALSSCRTRMVAVTASWSEKLRGCDVAYADNKMFITISHSPVILPWYSICQWQFAQCHFALDIGSSPVHDVVNPFAWIGRNREAILIRAASFSQVAGRAVNILPGVIQVGDGPKHFVGNICGLRVEVSGIDGQVGRTRAESYPLG